MSYLDEPTTRVAKPKVGSTIKLVQTGERFEVVGHHGYLISIRREGSDETPYRIGPVEMHVRYEEIP